MVFSNKLFVLCGVQFVFLSERQKRAVQKEGESKKGVLYFYEKK